MTKVKICGITNVDDAHAAQLAGADFVGLVFVEHSPRKVTLDRAHEIVQALRHQTPVVGVFKNSSIALVNKIGSDLELDLIQYHGEESPEVCQATVLPVIKAFSINKTFDWSVINAYRQVTKYIILDRPKDCKCTSWMRTVLDQLCHNRTQLPEYFFAGGLTPDNVGALVSHLKPFAVDVASGIETAPGIKDSSQMEQFIAAVQGANKQ